MGSASRLASFRTPSARFLASSVALAVVMSALALVSVDAPAALGAPGPDWNQKGPLHLPSARASASMAFDAATGQLVLFGGSTVSSGGNFVPFGDTWVWSGADWTQQSPAHSPPARDGASMGFDPATGQLVLFGGGTPVGGGMLFGDTWVWNGTDWSQQSPAHSPSVRESPSMAFDAATGQFVLFGGTGAGNPGSLNDTWAWNGTDWSQQSPTHSPAVSGPMAFDGVTGQLVLFGGATASETWVWNGTDWTQQSPTHSPPARCCASMDFDAATGQLVLFGGGTPFAELNDTWVWNGTDWSQQSPAHSPSIRESASMAFDAATGQLILFGGLSNVFLGDTWAWVATPDNEPPLVTITPTSPNGGTPDGANGWFVATSRCLPEFCNPLPVTGTVTVDDTTTGASAISTITCDENINGTDEGPFSPSNATGVGSSAIASFQFSIHVEGTTVLSCTGTDSAGNTSAPATITVKIDVTRPVVTCPSPAPQFVVGQTGQTISATVTDPAPGSGPASSPVTATATTASAGTFTVPLTGADNAGNSTTVNCGYAVVYGFGGFMSPLPNSTLDRTRPTIPVKFRLTDAFGQPINATLAAGLAAAGDVTVTLTGPGPVPTIAASATCTWDPKKLLFQCNINTPTGLLTGLGYAITAYENVGGGPVPVPSTGNPETVFFMK